MKKILLLAFIIGSTLSSCSKKGNDTPDKPKTPLSTAIDPKYISEGSDGSSIVVEYAQFKPNADCDKGVFNAAIQTIQTGNITKVTVNGANLIMVFLRSSNVQPASTSLTIGTALYKAVNQSWAWNGSLTIVKQNTFLTSDQFNKAINAQVFAVNTADEAQITSKTIGGDVMNIRYALTKSNPAYSQAVSYEVQASTPITFKSQFEVNCLIPGFISPQGTVVLDMAKSLTMPQQKDLGGGVISYTQSVNPHGVSESLSEYIAGRYFVEKVYPIVK